MERAWCVLLEDEMCKELAVIVWWGRSECSQRTTTQGLGVRRNAACMQGKGDLKVLRSGWAYTVWSEQKNWHVLVMWPVLRRAFQKDNRGKGLHAIAYLLALMRRAWNLSLRWRLSWHITRGCIRTCRRRRSNWTLCVSSWSLQAPSTSSLKFDHWQVSTMNTDISVNAKTDVCLMFCIVFCVSFDFSNHVFP